MTEARSSSLGTSGLALTRWTPKRGGDDALAVDDSALRASITSAIHEFLAKDLLIEGIRPPVVDGGEVECVECVVSGFMAPVTCRLDKAQLNALCKAAMGAREFSGNENDDLEGSIGRHISRCLMEVLLEKFCAASSAVCGQKIEPSFAREAMPRDALLSVHQVDVEKTQIDIDSGGARFEFLISKVDYARINARVEPKSNTTSEVRSDDAVKRFENSIGDVEIRLSALFDGRMVTAGEMRSWRKGSVVELGSSPRSHVRLIAKGKTLFQCDIARDSELFAVRLVGGGNEANGIEK